MSVKLVSITQPLVEANEFEELMSPEEYISYIARVSNPSNQLNTETAPRLLKYLIDHKHWSPFEFCDITLSITTRRSIAAQILRHRSFSFQEFSQRYSAVTNVETIELRKQAEKNRQSSEDVFDPQLSYRGTTLVMSELVESHMQNSMNLYNTMIAAGVAREVARDVLPLATETTLYMKGSIRSWIHYIQVRATPETQKEHRLIAEAAREIFIEKFPNIAEALGWIKT